MAVHLFAPQSYDFPSNYQRKISVIRSPFPICLLFICVICLIAIILPPISLAVFLESSRARLFRVLASCCARAMYCVPDEPLFRCRRDFFGKVLGGSEILRTFAVHCPKKPRSSRLPKIDAIGRRKGGRHIGYGIRYA